MWYCTIFLVTAMDIQMQISSPGMVCTVGDAELGQKWTRVSGQRIKETSVQTEECKLHKCLISIDGRERSLGDYQNNRSYGAQYSPGGILY